MYWLLLILLSLEFYLSSEIKTQIISKLAKNNNNNNNNKSSINHNNNVFQNHFLEICSKINTNSYGLVNIESDSFNQIVIGIFIYLFIISYYTWYTKSNINNINIYNNGNHANNNLVTNGNSITAIIILIITLIIIILRLRLIPCCWRMCKSQLFT